MELCPKLIKRHKYIDYIYVYISRVVLLFLVDVQHVFVFNLQRCMFSWCFIYAYVFVYVWVYWFISCNAAVGIPCNYAAASTASNAAATGATTTASTMS